MTSPHPCRALLLLSLAVLAAGTVDVTALAAAPSHVQTAPGRVLFATDRGVVQNNVDAGGGGIPVVLADRSVLLVSSSGTGAARRTQVVKLTAAGAIDATWGIGGATEITAGVTPLQVLRRPDGRMLVVGTVTAPGEITTSPPVLRVLQLHADGTLDTGFGEAGIATTAIGIGCGACTSAALTADGSLVLTGATGTYPTNPTPTSVPDLRWALTRLRVDGTVDETFGARGVATIPDVKATGFNVAALPDGAMITEGQTVGNGVSGDGVGVLLARLTPTGALDPAYGGGRPVRTPLYSGFAMLARDDGSTVIAGSERGGSTPPFPPGRRFVLAYTAAGAPDPAFSGDGSTTVAAEVQQILPAADRGMTIVGTGVLSFQPPTTPPATFFVGRWPASGPSEPALRPVQIPFGGGSSSFVVSVRPRPLPPLIQNSFMGRQQLTARPDGSFLAVGGVRVSQPMGEGVGFSIGRTAVAALTPGLVLDPAFGGPAAPLTATIALSRQRAHTAYERHGVRVRLRASAPGLWRVKIRTRDGKRVLAQSVLPVFGTTTRTLPVELTATGNRWLRGHRQVRVRVSTTARDLLGALTTASAVGTLR